MPSLRSLGLSCSLLVVASFVGGCHREPPQDDLHLIYIDLDDHGLAGLWAANAPTLQSWIKGGTLAFSRVDIPTHSNQSNETLITGCWPDADNLPSNGYLDRTNYRAALSLSASLTVGDYIFYDQNPLLTSNGGRVASIYSQIAPDYSTYVGMLPPFEHGASEVHFTLNGAYLEGLQITTDLATTLLECTLHYPPDYVKTLHLDGPPNPGESLGHYTMEDAAQIFRAAAQGQGTVPRVMFVWDFIALDGNPTNKFGADGPGLEKVIADYDHGLADLQQAVIDSGYGERTDFVLTLDHGKVDTNNQAEIEVTLQNEIQTKGSGHGVTVNDYALLDEDGDALVYARVNGAGTDPSKTAQQQAIAHGLVEMIQSGDLPGVDTTRTLTWDGYLGTHTFRDYHGDGPNQADIILFPKDNWTLGDVDGSFVAGPINPAVHPYPYGRHGGFSVDELYVPAIFYGPSFKKGRIIPVPIDHADVAPTALTAIGKDPPFTAQGYPVYAALANDPGETLADVTDPSITCPERVGSEDPMACARDVVLFGAGYTGQPALSGGTPLPNCGPVSAQGAIIIDVSGLYADSILPRQGQPYGASSITNTPFYPTDAGFMPSAVQLLMANGVTFENYETYYRDWPVTEYQMLTGTYPRGATYVPFAEDDPNQKTIPAKGLFAMPPAKNFVSDMAGYNAWHTGNTKFGDQSLFAVAKQMGLRTALIGSPDFQAQHIDPTDIDIMPSSGMGVAQLLAGGGKQLIYYAVDGGAKASDAEAAAEAAVGEVQTALAGHRLDTQMLVVLTSRGGAPIDAQNADAFGIGSARHVPLIISGPSVRKGVILSGPARPVDITPTVLFGLGQPTRTDFVDGTQIDGGTDPGTGMFVPVPSDAISGHVQVHAFTIPPYPYQP
jgi:hypothetical protein